MKTKPLWVLLCGLWCNQSLMKGLLPAKSRGLPHELLILDDGLQHPGFEAGVGAMLERIRKVARGRPVVLVGHSFGAQYALALAPKVPNLQALVLLAPALGRLWMIEGVMRTMRAVLLHRENWWRILIGPADNAWMRGENMNAMLEGYEEPPLYQRLCHMRAAMDCMGVNRMPPPDTPVMVVWGEADGLVERQHVPDAHVVNLPGHGHMLWLRDPTVWAQIQHWVAAQPELKAA